MLLSTRALRRFCTVALLPIVCACTASSSSTRLKPLEPPPALPVATRPEAPKDPPPPTSPPPVLLRGATVITAAGPRIERGHVLLEGGKIKAVGEGAGTAPKGATVVDATGRFITPGLIDTHSHMGVYPAPGSRGNSDGNEATSPTRPEVWAEHGFWPQDPNLPRAVAGGITTIQVLPGSANLIGGRSFTAKLRLIPGATTSARQLRFPGAPQGLKMACGENPKRVYGDKGGPETRMGNVARFRQTFQQAREYQRRWQKYERDLAAWRAKQEYKRQNPDASDDDKGKGPPGPDDPPELPGVDAAMDTLVGVLDGSILVHNHCYRADEMNIMLDVADEFGFSIRSFHHALEAYKLAPRLAQTQTSVSTWADWWGFKMESYDGIPHNAALVHAAGGIAVIHSDSETEIRHLNQEAGKALAAGRRLGLSLSDDDAVTWVTKNAAWALGVEDQTGTLEVGKMADVVVWSADPLSVYARADHVYVDGALVYDRKTGTAPVTDFELENGQTLPQQQTHGAPADPMNIQKPSPEKGLRR